MLKRNEVNMQLVNDMAEELVKRYGDEAVKVAKERAATAKTGRFPSDRDIALLVLTAVEKLTD